MAQETGASTGVNEVIDQYYSSTLESVDLAESEILKAAEEAGFDEDERHRIGMAVRECMVNAVVHGNRYNRNKTVHIGVNVEMPERPEQSADHAGDAGTPASQGADRAIGTRLTIRITDQGDGFEMLEVPDPLHENNLLRHSGRGLFLMGAFMDDLKVRKLPEGGTEVTLIKDIGPAE
jgi:serine/threonine-protein kinase RsbW